MNDDEQDEQGEEPQVFNPVVRVPADGRMVDEPFEARLDVASQWDARNWRRA
jgi:hypothetical protein